MESYEVNLTDFLKDLRSDFDAPSDKEVRMVWDFPSELPIIKTDSEKLKHMLRNLINNAVKFTDKGTVTVSVRVLEEKGASRRKVGGVGLGLYIVKRLVGTLGGTIEVESEPGKGSTFTVTIPHAGKRP